MEDEPLIFHVALSEEWERCQDESHYSPAGYLKEGFIHCCSRFQLGGVLERYFKGKKGLLLLHLTVGLLDSPVRYEASADGDFFPHIYGRIPKPSVVKLEVIDNQ